MHVIVKLSTSNASTHVRTPSPNTYQFNTMLPIRTWDQTPHTRTPIDLSEYSIMSNHSDCSYSMDDGLFGLEVT